MKLIIGLGNPGQEYKNTRHNAGFLALDEIKRHYKASDWEESKKFEALCSEFTIDGEKIILAKPVTFMNLSGLSAQKITSFYKIAPENCLIIFDDIDLAVGIIRYRDKGSAGTHNGMKSILSSLGTNNVKRLRIGINSENKPEKIELKDYVLSNFSDTEKEVLQKNYEKIIEIIDKNII